MTDTTTTDGQEEVRGDEELTATIDFNDICCYISKRAPFIAKPITLTEDESNALIELAGKRHSAGEQDFEEYKQTLLNLWKRSRYFDRIYMEPDLFRGKVSTDRPVAERNRYVLVELSNGGLEEGDADFRLTANVDEYTSAYYPYKGRETEIHTFQKDCEQCMSRDATFGANEDARCFYAETIAQYTFEADLKRWLSDNGATVLDTLISHGLFSMLAKFK